MRFFPALLLMVISLNAFSQSRQIEENMTVDGMKRSFVSYVPTPKDKDYKMPLVISLHGGFASPKGQFHLADFRPLADQDKFIVVCPASKHLWHDGADNKGIDDVKFMDQIINYVIKNIQCRSTACVYNRDL